MWAVTPRRGPAVVARNDAVRFITSSLRVFDGELRDRARRGRCSLPGGAAGGDPDRRRG
jgi:hypothetical protein